jgi:methionyl-tRNA formyltransferase
MGNAPTYIVAGSRPWNRRVFDQLIVNFPGNWHFISEPEQLTASWVGSLAPRYIFFLHWSWKVPSEIVNNYECIAFHMTDVPYGRGGSPLQNLILRGHKRTKLTALRLVEDFDAGPVYLKQDLDLYGNAEEIYVRATYLSAQMINQIINEQPQPQPQMGEVVTFKRRRPQESRIPPLKSLEDLQDFIRMLDAEGYPHAFLEHEGFIYEFGRAQLYHDKIVANVTIRPTGRQED